MERFGNAFEKETLEAPFMIFLDDQIPAIPADAVVALGIEGVAVGWLRPNATWIELHVKNDGNAAPNPRVAILRRVLAPYWFSMFYPLSSLDDKWRAA